MQGELTSLLQPPGATVTADDVDRGLDQLRRLGLVYATDGRWVIAGQSRTELRFPCDLGPPAEPLLRAYDRAALDRVLPGAFARVHPRWRTPHLSILALGAVGGSLYVGEHLLTQASARAVKTYLLTRRAADLTVAVGIAWLASALAPAMSAKR